MPSKIEWTDETWNPIRARNRETGKVGHFCIHISDGCKNCYAERIQPRFGNPVRYAAQDIGKVDLFLDEGVLTQPLRWKRPRMVFVCSMTDLFLEIVPTEWIDRIFAVMAEAEHHKFQVLSKRTGRMADYLDEAHRCGPYWLAEHGISERPWPWDNVWIGVSAENQETYHQRRGNLEDAPAAVRFLSLEPLLGPIDLLLDADYGRLSRKYRWVIAGGESGPGARPMHPEWARSIRDQCVAAGVPFFFKQFGEWAWSPDEMNYAEGETWAWVKYGKTGDSVVAHSSGHTAARVGKKFAGRLLDGRTWDEMPG